MFGWLFSNPRVTAVARVIHEMSSYSHHMKSIGGSSLTFFEEHPMLKNHRAPAPSDPDQMHVFYLTDGQQGFGVMVRDDLVGDQGWVSIAPDGDFRDAHIQSTQKNKYIVRVERYPSPHGRLATKLVDAFVKQYDAANATIQVKPHQW